jgi:hypothetical protein
MAPVQLLLPFFLWPFFPSLPLPVPAAKKGRQSRTESGMLWAFLQDLSLIVLLLILRVPIHQPPRVWVAAFLASLTMKATDGPEKTL